jgi:hypothetical protein
MKNKIELIFKIKNNFIVPELVMRILFFVISFLNYKSMSSNEIMEHHVYDFFWVAIAVNVFLVLLTLYFNYRRVLTIKRVIEIRTINNPRYQDASIQFKSDYEHSNFGFLVTIQTITFFLSIVMIPFLITNLKKIQPESSYIFLGLFISIVYFSILYVSKKFYLSNELQKVKLNGKDFSSVEMQEFKGLFKSTNLKALYFNDELIIKVSKSANEYKQRIETLLIESVFIGALTFGTFVQLTSPESISSISDIEDKEKEHHEKVEKLKFKLKDLNSELKNNGLISLPIRVEEKKTMSLIWNPSDEVSYNVGYFSNWSNDRKLTILSFYYKNISDEEKYRLLAGDFICRGPEKSISIYDEINYLRSEIESILSDTLQMDKNLIKLSNLSARFVLCNEIHKVFIQNESQTEKFRRLFIRINPSLLSKYNSIMKSSWDEQEYIFLIAIGSIICSVFYISVLIKRYPIVISIEKLLAEIDKAKMWNIREENMYSKKIETEIMHLPDELIVQYDNKIEYYSEKIQNQLASCENIASKIETNISIVSLFRSIGLGMFFTVLLISTLMIDYSISIFLLIVITYAIFIAEILNENSLITSFFRLFWKKPSSNSNLYDYD